VDAVYFTLGTFTTTGTGRIAAHSSLAELLVSGQVVLGWAFVAMVVALYRAQRPRARVAPTAGSSFAPGLTVSGPLRRRARGCRSLGRIDQARSHRSGGRARGEACLAGKAGDSARDWAAAPRE
jgi:Ion channel